MKNRMDLLWAMQVFTRVVDCGSFSRAAESLDVANATVTASVRNLEKHLGVALLSRNTRTLRLTDAGDIYFKRCLEMLKLAQQSEYEVKGREAAVEGLLRIESPAAFGKEVIAPVLPLFTARHPEVSVALRFTDYPEDLIESDTDLAIRMDNLNDADLVARPLYQAHYILCATPAFVARLDGPGHPSDIDPRHCLGIFRRGSYTSSAWHFSLGDEQHVIQPAGSLHFNSTDALISAALADQGLVHVLDVFANELIASGKLVALLPQWKTSVRTFFAVTPGARYVAPRTRAFIDFILETLDTRRRPPVGTQVGLHK